jgi:tRNA(Arg) A34 adenosine deaminase TadA
MKNIYSTMNFLFDIAENAFKSEGEFPVSAAIIKSGQIISYSSNQTEKFSNFLKHAEVLSIEKACSILKTKYLNDCEIFITLEPCFMCLHAINLCRIKKIIFGAYNRTENSIENYIYSMRKQNITVSFDNSFFGGFQEERFSELIKKFFSKKREL